MEMHRPGVVAANRSYADPKSNLWPLCIDHRPNEFGPAIRVRRRGRPAAHAQTLQLPVAQTERSTALPNNL